MQPYKRKSFEVSYETSVGLTQKQKATQVATWGCELAELALGKDPEDERYWDIFLFQEETDLSFEEYQELYAYFIGILS